MGFLEQIQYIGLDEVEEMDRSTLDRLSSEYYDKIQREIKNDTSLQIHIKGYKKQGNKKKYAIHVKAVAPTVIFTSTKAVDWDFARTLHKAFNDLEVQIKHRLHSDDQKPKDVFKRAGPKITPEFAKRIGVRLKDMFSR